MGSAIGDDDYSDDDEEEEEEEEEEDETDASEDEEDFTDQEIEDAQNTVQRFRDSNEGISLKKVLKFYLKREGLSDRKKKAIRRVVEDLMDEEEEEEKLKEEPKKFSEKDLQDGRDLLKHYRGKSFSDAAIKNNVRTEIPDMYEVVKFLIEDGAKEEEEPSDDELKDIEETIEKPERQAMTFDETKREVQSKGLILRVHTDGNDVKVGYEEPTPKLHIVPERR